MNKINPFILFLLIGLTLSAIFSSGQIENPDTHLRLTQSRICLENHTFFLPNDVGEDSHGNIAINSQGKRHMVYNPGQTLFFIPIYYFAELLTNNNSNCYYVAAFFVSFINIIIHSLCSYLLYLIAIALGALKPKAYLTAFVFCFTSYSFSFAQSTFEHHFEMFFILLSVYFILSKKINYNAFLSGLAITVGLVFRSTAILALPAILLIANSKQRLYFALGVFPGLLIILFYNYYRFGNPFESGYNLAWHLAHSNNFSFWSIKRLPESLFGLLFSPAKGLFIFSPTIILGLLGFHEFWQKHKKIALAFLIFIVINLIIFSMNFAWHGSIWSFGPRYILPILPFLYLPIIEVKIRKSIYPIIIIAAISQILLMSVNYKREVLEQYIKYNGIDENKYLFSFGNIPYIVQAKQLKKILPKNIKMNLVNDFPNSPWKKEIRTASATHVLNYSIEKNSINFWWIRVFQLNSNRTEKAATIILIIFSICCLFFILKYAKKLV